MIPKNVSAGGRFRAVSSIYIYGVGTWVAKSEAKISKMAEIEGVVRRQFQSPARFYIISYDH